MPVGDDRGPRRRQEGTHRVDRRLPGVHRILGGSAARRPNAAGCGRRYWPWAMVRSGSGPHCGTCSRRPGSSGAGSTSPRMCLRRCRSRRTPPRSGRCRRSTTPRTATWPGSRPRRSPVDYGAKFPKAVAKIIDDLDVLLEFYNFPAEHWVHLRTTNPIESTFATVRHRTKVTKGPGSRAAGLAMAFKLIEAAQARWRAVNAPQLVALVRAGATFHHGKLVERPADDTETRSPKRSSSTSLDYCSRLEAKAACRPPVTCNARNLQTDANDRTCV